MTTAARPAFYAAGRGTGGARDWLTLLHPPYTAWHLSYVAIGAALVPHLVLWRLVGTLVAFFLAVGVGAHALDELNGRPLRTGIPGPLLVGAGAGGVGAAVVAGLVVGGWRLLPFVVVGAVLAVGYNLELLGGRLHDDAVFAAAWGAFPVLTGYYVQHWTLALPAGLAAAAAFALSWGQRALSTPARELRRRTRSVRVDVESADGERRRLGADEPLAPLERALHAFSWGVACVAAALVVARL